MAQCHWSASVWGPGYGYAWWTRMFCSDVAAWNKRPHLKAERTAFWCNSLVLNKEIKAHFQIVSPGRQKYQSGREFLNTNPPNPMWWRKSIGEKVCQVSKADRPSGNHLWQSQAVCACSLSHFLGPLNGSTLWNLEWNLNSTRLCSCRTVMFLCSLNTRMQNLQESSVNFTVHSRVSWEV